MSATTQISSKYQFRRERDGRLVNVFTYPSDFPEASEEYDLCVCRYTGGLFTRKDGEILGPVVPQAPASAVCHPLAREARRECLRWFEDSEENCNNCAHLVRVQFDREEWAGFGLFPAKCSNENRKPFYPRGGDDILVAPEDCMRQECFVHRKGNGK